MNQVMKKVIALCMSLLMVVSLLPTSVFAAEYTEADGDYYRVISQKDWELAPGITESEIIINNAAGDRQQVMHVVEVDVNNEYAKVIPSSKNMVPTPGQYGVQTMDLQAKYAEENGYGNVVAAMNISLSWYDSAYYDQHPELKGEPLGYLILDGVQYTNSQGKTAGASTCLVINFDEKDGEARPADMPKVQIRSTSDEITGWEEQVIPANFGYVVKDGKLVTTKEEHTSEGASRSMLGIKEDGTIVMVMNDGRQAPYSTGFNSYEMGEAMLKLGCVYAINGDGGGSSQFLSQRPGEELELHCSPSDGSPRATTHGVLAISTAPSTGEFVRAHVASDYAYYTPNSSVQFKAVGSDLAGSAAEIPAEATWVLSDDSMGTIDANGLFVSNGKLGTVEAQLVYEGAVKGSASIEIVVPDSISFDSAAYTAPFNESINFKVIAKYDVFEVALNSNDYTIVLGNNDLGTLDGLKYTAGAVAGTINATVTLTHNTIVNASATVTVGKGSEVIFSFEEGTAGADLSNWEIKDHEGKYTPYSDLAIVTKENGMVHNGETSLAVHVPSHTRVTGGEGYAANSITWVGDRILLENATAIGMWIYIPEEATQTEIALNYVWYNDEGVQQRTTPDLCLNDDFNNNEYSGWHYLSVPIKKTMAYIEDAKDVEKSQGYKRNFFLKFYVTNSGNAGDESSYMTDITYYIDDVTVDYSSAVADRVAPEFKSTSVQNVESEMLVGLSNGTTAKVNGSTFSFIAEVADNIGVDASSANVYVDGKEVAVNCKNNRITSADVDLQAGVHRVVYEIYDTTGNVKKAVRYINVAGDNVAIEVVAHNPEAEVALTGSVYSVDIVAPEAKDIEKVTVKLDLDDMHTWEADHMELAQGYEAKYYFANVADQKDNVLTIELTNKNSEVTGKAVLASIPARVWSYCGAESGATYTPAQAWTTGAITAVSVNVEVEYGEVVYTNNTSKTFSAETLHLDTEAYIHQYKMDVDYLKAHTYHVHEAVAIEKVATCTENGYTGRTFCEECNSPVEWGTVLNATGHKYEFNAEGKLVCECGKPFNGIHTDGKYYVDGVTIADGWVEESYYKDGLKLTGVHVIDGKYYNFGEDGICANKYPMSAEWWTNANGESYYFNAGVPVTGYNMINGTPTNFDENGIAFQGEITINNEVCVFEKGAFVKSTTGNVWLAGLAGPKAYFVLYEDGTLVLCGDGETYDYVATGSNFGPNISWKNRPWGKKDTEYTQGIKKIVVGKDITEIGVYTFYMCTNVEEIIFEENSNLDKIDNIAFMYLTKLKTLELPNSLKTIGGQAFAYNSSLVEVQIPQGITSISSNAFMESKRVVLNVVEGTYAENYANKYGINHTTRPFVEGVVAEGTCGEKATWTLYESGKLVIGGSGAIDNFANKNEQPWANYRDQIYKVEIGKDITHIGKFAFAYAYNLEDVKFEEGSKLESIDSFGIYYSLRLQELVIPETVKTLAGQSLAYNSKLVNVYVPQGTNSISSTAFMESKKVVLNVAEGTYAENYADKYGVNHITRPFVEGVVAEGTCGEKATWTLYESGKLVIGGSGAIDNFANKNEQPWANYRNQIYKVEIGKDITHIGKFAFAYAYYLEDVKFEEGSKLESIDSFGIYYSLRLQELVIPETVKTLAGQSLAYNSKLVNVYVPQGTSSISSTAFMESKKVVLNVAEGTYAENYADKYGVNHTTRPFVEGVVAEGTCGEKATWALYESGKLVIGGSGAIDNFANKNEQPWANYRNQIYKVEIGKDITHIGKFAFAYAYNLEDVKFEEGSKLESIDSFGIYYSLRLQELVIPETVKTLAGQSLAYNSKLVNVYVPQGTNSISSTAFMESKKVVLNVAEGTYAENYADKYGVNHTTRPFVE